MYYKNARRLTPYSLLLFLIMLCPLPMVAQTYTPVVELTSNGNGTYTATYKAVTETPERYAYSGAGTYSLNASNIIESADANKYLKITQAVIDESMANASPTSTAYWFYNLGVKTIEGMANLNTSEVTDMSHMFDGSTGLGSLDLSHFDTGKVTNMSYMFRSCSSLTSLDVSHFNTGNVTDMSYMFRGCSSLTSLDLSDFNTGKVTDMSYMFYYCNNLRSLDLSSFNTGKVTDMNNMFNNCNRLRSLDLSHFNTGNVTNMSYMFNNCNNLGSLDLSHFDTSKVTSMDNMFEQCTSLTSLNVSGFDTGKVETMAYMFRNCSKLTALDLSSFNTGEVTAMHYMFRGCSSLTSLDLSHFNTSKVTTMTYMFGYCSNLTSLNVSGFDTGEVTSMTGTFRDCSSLPTLDLSSFNTSKVERMNEMFLRCRNLADLKFDVNKFNTENVVNMNQMFSVCSSLTKLDVSHFNTGKVMDMSYMFGYCSKLTALDVSHFDTQNVQTMLRMFTNCATLTQLDVSHFKTDKVITMTGLFEYCSNLTRLDVSNFNTSKVELGPRNAQGIRTGMDNMFFGCSKLTRLDVSNFDFSGLKDINNFARGCSALEELNLGSHDFTTLNTIKEGDRTVTQNDFGSVGTRQKPCRLIETFGRTPLGNVNINRDAQVPPYYWYCDGYFTIADTLDAGQDYTLEAKAYDNADLWVKARTLKKNVWNTFVLPAGVTQDQLKKAFGDDVQVCVLSGYDGTTVKFSTFTDDVKANTPVLIKPSQDIGNVGFAQVDITAASANDKPTTTVHNGNLTANFIGSYKQQIPIDNNCFYYFDGKFMRSAGNSTVRNTRGYFTFSDGGTGAKQFVLDDGGETTAIDAIDGEPAGPQGPAYNLGGQRVGDNYKGIVIIGGKKVLRR